MLCSSFSKDCESVFVDILTFADLETLRQRKLGINGSNNLNSSSSSTGNNNVTVNTSLTSTSNMKRYVILTYSAEFDRVHYPLPLSFETIPNVDSLRRTIIRLRNQVSALTLSPSNSAGMSDDDKSIRIMLSQLRQENTELRHRLRQLESRSSKTANAPSTSTLSSPSLSSASPTHSSSVVESKLRLQIDYLKKQLSDASISFNSMKSESAKEVNKLKTKLYNFSKSDSLDFYTNTSATDGLVSLKKRIFELERENSTLRRSKLSNVSTGVRSYSSQPRSYSSSNLDRNFVHSNNGHFSSYKSTSGIVPNRQRSSTPPIQAQNRSKHTSKPSSSSSTLSASDASKRLNQQRQRQVPSSSVRSRSTSPTISSTNRIELTEYAKQKAERLPRKSSQQVWGSNTRSTSNTRYSKSRESGYSSAASQSSRESSRQTSRGTSSRTRSKRISGSKMASNINDTNSKSSISRKFHDDNYHNSDDDASKSNSHRISKASRSSSTTYTKNKSPSDNTTATKSDKINHNNVSTLVLEPNQSKAEPYSAATFSMKSNGLRDGILRTSNSSISSVGSSKNITPRSSLRFSRESLSGDKNDQQNMSVLSDQNSNGVSITNTTASDQNMTDIDKRIKALQNYLDTARSSVLSDDAK